MIDIKRLQSSLTFHFTEVAGNGGELVVKRLNLEEIRRIYLE